MFFDKHAICDFFIDGEKIDHDLSEKFSVFRKEGIIWLQFDQVYFQTAMDTNNPAVPVFPYIQAMLMVVAMRLAPITSVLNLGTGGAAIERFIAHHLADATQDSVEFSADVIAIAKQYFYLPDTANVIETDAFEFISRPSQQYDLIFVDLFAEDFYHDRLLDVTVWENLASCTTSTGSLVLNIVVHEMDKLVQIVDHIQQFFSYVAVFHMDDFQNVVMYCQSDSFVSLYDLKNTSKELNERWELDFTRLLEYVVYLPKLLK